MKFGNLLLTLSGSNEAFKTLYNTYKRSKKAIKRLNFTHDVEHQQEEQVKESAFAEDLVNSIRFIVTEKASLHNRCVVKLNELRQQACQLKSHPVYPDDNESDDRLHQLYKDTVHFHGEVLLVMHWSMLAYTMCLKILKKHNKRTGMLLQAPELHNILSQPSWSTEEMNTMARDAEQLVTQVQMLINQRQEALDNMPVIVQPDQAGPSTLPQDQQQHATGQQQAAVQSIEILDNKHIMDAMQQQQQEGPEQVILTVSQQQQQQQQQQDGVMSVSMAAMHGQSVSSARGAAAAAVTPTRLLSVGGMTISTDNERGRKRNVQGRVAIPEDRQHLQPSAPVMGHPQPAGPSNSNQQEVKPVLAGLLLVKEGDRQVQSEDLVHQKCPLDANNPSFPAVDMFARRSLQDCANTSRVRPSQLSPVSNPRLVRGQLVEVMKGYDPPVLCGTTAPLSSEDARNEDLLAQHETLGTTHSVTQHAQHGPGVGSTEAVPGMVQVSHMRPHGLLTQHIGHHAQHAPAPDANALQTDVVMTSQVGTSPRPSLFPLGAPTSPPRGGPIFPMLSRDISMRRVDSSAEPALANMSWNSLNLYSEIHTDSGEDDDDDDDMDDDDYDTSDGEDGAISDGGSGNGLWRPSVSLAPAMPAARAVVPHAAGRSASQQEQVLQVPHAAGPSEQEGNAECCVPEHGQHHGHRAMMMEDVNRVPEAPGAQSLPAAPPASQPVDVPANQHARMGRFGGEHGGGGSRRSVKAAHSWDGAEPSASGSYSPPTGSSPTSDGALPEEAQPASAAAYHALHAHHQQRSHAKRAGSRETSQGQHEQGYDRQVPQQQQQQQQQQQRRSSHGVSLPAASQVGFEDATSVAPALVPTTRRTSRPGMRGHARTAQRAAQQGDVPDQDCTAESARMHRAESAGDPAAPAGNAAAELRQSPDPQMLHQMQLALRAWDFLAHGSSTPSTVLPTSALPIQMIPSTSQQQQQQQQVSQAEVVRQQHALLQQQLTQQQQ